MCIKPSSFLEIAAPVPCRLRTRAHADDPHKRFRFINKTHSRQAAKYIVSRTTVLSSVFGKAPTHSPLTFPTTRMTTKRTTKKNRERHPWPHPGALSTLPTQIYSSSICESSARLNPTHSRHMYIFSSPLPHHQTGTNLRARRREHYNGREGAPTEASTEDAHEVVKRALEEASEAST